jgi:hypothetical protein
MTTEIFKKKTDGYLRGQSVQEEMMRIQNRQTSIAAEERTIIENEIAGLVLAFAISSLDIPKPEPSWWKKIMAAF